MKYTNAKNAMGLEKGDILVLNASYEPLNITSWKRAMVLLMKKKAVMLSSKTIKLCSYVQVSISKLLMRRPSKNAIYKRDRYKCQYCGATSRLTIDHVLAKCRGGTDDWNNLVVACSTCNSLKGDKLLEHTPLKLQRKPAPLTRVSFTIETSSVEEWKQYAFG